MITFTELLVVLVAFSLVGGYMAIMRHILNRVDRRPPAPR